MNKYISIGLVISFLFAIAYYLGTNSLIFTILLLVITFAYFLVVIARRFAKFNNKVKRFHECYFFINNFVVGLSIKSSVSAALENLYSSMSSDYQEEIKACDEMNDEEKLRYLEKFFPFHIYQLFLDVFLLWVEQGGDIIQMSNHLTIQLRESEELIVFSESNNRSHLVEFSMLWGFAIAIVVALRFALSIFFETISKQLFFQIGIFAVFLFVLVSIEILTRRMVDIEIKGARFENE